VTERERSQSMGAAIGERHQLGADPVHHIGLAEQLHPDRILPDLRRAGNGMPAATEGRMSVVQSISVLGSVQGGGIYPKDGQRAPATRRATGPIAY